MPNRGQFSVELNDVQMRATLRALSGVRKGVPRALSRGNNAAAARAKTQAKREIAKEIALKQATIAAPMKVQKGNVKNNTALVRIPQKGLLIGFYDFRELKSGRFSVRIHKKGSRFKYPEDVYHKPRLRYSKPPRGSLAIGTPGSGSWLYGPSPSQAFETKIDEQAFLQLMSELQSAEILRAINSILATQ